MCPEACEDAISRPTATLLLVAITLLLAVLVLLLFQLPQFDIGLQPSHPSFLEIKSIGHITEHGVINFDSRVTLYHNGTISYKNDQLYPVFYRNSKRVPCVIETLNGYQFIQTHHFGVQTMAGLGCSGDTWNPNEKIAIDFTDGTFRPCDLVTVEVYLRPSDVLISRHSRTA